MMIRRMQPKMVAIKRKKMPCDFLYNEYKAEHVSKGIIKLNQALMVIQDVEQFPSRQSVQRSMLFSLLLGREWLDKNCNED